MVTLITIIVKYPIINLIINLNIFVCLIICLLWHTGHNWLQAGKNNHGRRPAFAIIPVPVM